MVRAVADARFVLRATDVQALDRLPSMYAEVLRRRERGEDADAIAVQLGIEPEAVEPLVQVAKAKLVALLAADSVGPEHRAARR